MNFCKTIAITVLASSTCLGIVTMQPASANTQCKVAGVRSVPGENEKRESFSAIGDTPQVCASRIENAVYEWCKSFPYQGGAYCRSDQSTFSSSSSSSTSSPSRDNSSTPATSQRTNSCPNNNIEIRTNSSNLEFSRGKEWITCSKYKFIFQVDGNLVLYNQAGSPIWSSRTINKADLFAIQADGNVVLYGEGRAVWATNAGNNRGAFLAIQSDGNVVVYSSSGRGLWETGTTGR